MNDLAEYLVLRYSLVEESQGAIEPMPLPNIKGQAILPAIEQDREYVNHGVLYSVVGFHELASSHGFEFPNKRFYLGKLAKRKSQQTGERVPGDIIEFTHDNWIPLTVVFDVVTQHIFVTKDWKFGKPEQTVKALQYAFTEPVLSIFNHRVFVEGKTAAGIFWDIVNTKRKIYSLTFNLISPNILDTNLKAREALEVLKEIFGQDETDISLKNESGELKVPEIPTQNYLEYIAEGEGRWKLVTEGNNGGKKTYSSVENIDTLSLPKLGSEKADSAQLELGHIENNQSGTNYEEANLGAKIFAAIKNMGKE
jgi:hypothetical protein